MGLVIERSPSWSKKRVALTQCGYHFGGLSEGCRQIQLRSNPLGKVHWAPAIWACPDCRKHLQGLFRYAKEVLA